MKSLRNEAYVLAVLVVAHVWMIALDFSGVLILPRVLVSLLVLFFVPGYLLQAALFARQHQLEVIERLAMSIGLSIATVPPLTLLLEHLQFADLSTVPIVFSQVFAIILIWGVSLYRRLRIPQNERFFARVHIDLSVWWDDLGIGDRVLFSLIGVAFSVAFGMGILILFAPSPAAHLTEFYILGQDGIAENYPRYVVPGEPMYVTFGVINREGDAMRYHVEVWADERHVATSDAFLLKDGERIEDRVQFLLDDPNPEQRLQFQLYRRDELMHELRLWVEIPQS